MTSKHRIFVILFLGVISKPVHAQSTMSYGVKAGISISNIRYANLKQVMWIADYPYVDQSTVSPLIAVFCRPLTRDYFSLEVEAVYARKGATRSDDIIVTTADNPDGGETVPYTTEFGFQHLVLGIALEPRYPVGAMTVHGTIEPTASYILSATNLPSGGDQLRRFVFGYQLGLGIDVPRLFRTPISVDIKYAGDFTRFYQTIYADFWNRSWMMTLGVQL